MSDSHSTHCLILACGNTLRSDDGAGPWLAAWAEERFASNPSIRVISPQQWTPELAEDLASAQSAIFIDCSLAHAPGSIEIVPINPASGEAAPATHHLGAPQLLALARDLFSSTPQQAFLLTIGAASTELGEEFTEPVLSALPHACKLLEDAIAKLLSVPPQRL
jgi:hydrogenase maturation protease